MIYHIESKRSEKVLGPSCWSGELEVVLVLHQLEAIGNMLNIHSDSITFQGKI